MHACMHALSAGNSPPRSSCRDVALAAKKIESVTEFLAQKQRLLELELKTKKAEKLGLKSFLLPETRRLVKEGYLATGEKRKKMFFILCSDVLIIAEPDTKKGTFTADRVIELSKASISMNPGSTTSLWNFNINVQGAKAPLNVSCMSKDELEGWSLALRAQLDEN